MREVLLLPYHVLQLQSTLCFNAAFISSVRLFVGKTLNLCVCVCRLISGKRWDAACPEHHKAPQKLFIQHRRTTNNRKPSRCCKLFCQVLVSHLNHKAFEVHWSLKDSCRVEHTILLVTARARPLERWNHDRKAPNYRYQYCWMSECPFSGHVSFYYITPEETIEARGGQSG